MLYDFHTTLCFLSYYFAWFCFFFVFFFFFFLVLLVLHAVKKKKRIRRRLRRIRRIRKIRRIRRTTRRIRMRRIRIKRRIMTAVEVNFPYAKYSIWAKKKDLSCGYPLHEGFGGFIKCAFIKDGSKETSGSKTY